MRSELRRAGFSIFFGGFFGSVVSLEFWPAYLGLNIVAGMLCGFVISYFLLDIQQTARVFWAMAVKKVSESLRATVAILRYVFLRAHPVFLGYVFIVAGIWLVTNIKLDFEPGWRDASIPMSFFAGMMLNFYILLCGANFSEVRWDSCWLSYSRNSQKIEISYRSFLPVYFWGSAALIFAACVVIAGTYLLILLSIAAIFIWNILIASIFIFWNIGLKYLVGFAVLGFAMFAAAKIFFQTARIIHSNGRLLCGFYGLFAVLISSLAFWIFGEDPAQKWICALIGALIGIVIGIADYELLFKRRCRNAIFETEKTDGK